MNNSNNNGPSPPFRKPARPACKVERHSMNAGAGRRHCRCGAGGSTAGIIVMLAGALVLVLCVPFWFWPLAIGAALLAIGFILMHKP